MSPRQARIAVSRRESGGSQVADPIPDCALVEISLDSKETSIATVVSAEQERYQKAENAKERDALRVEVQRLKDEIVAVQEIQSHCQPGQQMHGFIWLFQREPAQERKR